MSTSSKAPLIDPVSISDTFCYELAKVETFGAFARLTFATPQNSAIREEPELERVIVAKIVVPRDSLAAMARALSDPSELPTDAAAANVERLVN